MNKTFHIGRLVKKPEERLTANGKSVVSFSLAIKRNYKNAEGNYDSDFINYKAFGHSATFISRYCEKGDLIATEGSIRTGAYTDKKGNKQYTTDIVVDNVKLLNKKQEQVKQEAKDNEQVDIYSEFGEEIEINENYLD